MSATSSSTLSSGLSRNVKKDFCPRTLIRKRAHDGNEDSTNVYLPVLLTSADLAVSRRFPEQTGGLHNNDWPECQPIGATWTIERFNLLPRRFRSVRCHSLPRQLGEMHVPLDAEESPRPFDRRHTGRAASASRGSIESLSIIQDNEYLDLLCQVFVRRVTIFCLPGSAIACARVAQSEALFFCKQHLNWPVRGVPTVVRAMSRLALRKLRENPRVTSQLDFDAWPRPIEDVFPDVFSAFVTGQNEFLHRADELLGQAAIDSLFVALDDFLQWLRTGADALS